MSVTAWGINSVARKKLNKSECVYEKTMRIVMEAMFSVQICILC